MCVCVLIQLLFWDTNSAKMHGRRPADHRNKKEKGKRKDGKGGERARESQNETGDRGMKGRGQRGGGKEKIETEE